MDNPFITTVSGGGKSIDASEVRRALGFLIDPGQAFQLQGLPSGRWRICHGDRLDEAVKVAEEMGGEKGVYWTLNPCRPDYAGPGSVKVPDILSRRWLLIDADPERPDRDSSSTDAEHTIAVELALSVHEYLAGFGWPPPVIIDSGNGAHLLYRIDLPTGKLSQQLLRDILARLGDRFDSDRAKIDRKVHNANRISKLPGTWARKGPDTPERPHRLARLIWTPPTIDVVSIDQLRAVDPATGVFQGIASDGSLSGYVRSAIERECARVLLAPQGGRNNILNAAAFNLGTMSDWPEMDAQGARRSLLESAERAGLSGRESLLTIASGWGAGTKAGRIRPESGASRNGAHTPIDPAKRLIVWAKDVVPRKVQWLWPGRIPIGKMTTFAGQTGMGKTFSICDIAARITRGAEIPFGDGECFSEGKVLIISAEDDADDTIVPRFMELEGDRSKLAFLSPEAEDQFSLAALELLNASLDQMGDDIRMVAIDPPTSYLSGIDDHRNAELRGLLNPLKRWALQRWVALVFITHVNKPSASKVDAMARVMGSAAWVQAVRAAHMFCPDPHERSRSLFIPLKVNNAPKGKGIAYRIKATREDLAIIEWIEEVDTTADEAMSQDKKQPLVRDAKEVVIEMFNMRREWPSDDFWAYLDANGVERRPFDRARAELQIPKTRQVVSPKGDRMHTWWVPDDWPWLEALVQEENPRASVQETG